MTPHIIKGGEHIDSRGKVTFVNDFDLSPVKRFYQIAPVKDVVRAWQGHINETKWFFCVAGEFKIKLIKPKNWENPEEKIQSFQFTLSEKEPMVLHVPGGFYNGFVATQKNSILQVYSDLHLDDSLQDDYRLSEKIWKF